MLAAQMSVRTFFTQQKAQRVDAVNGIGPYKTEDTEVSKHINCNNYDACVSFAAREKWDAFTCVGCRKAVGTFEY